jgi:hypothetical protein
MHVAHALWLECGCMRVALCIGYGRYGHEQVAHAFGPPAPVLSTWTNPAKSGPGTVEDWVGLWRTVEDGRPHFQGLLNWHRLHIFGHNLAICCPFSVILSATESGNRVDYDSSV